MTNESDGAESTRQTMQSISDLNEQLQETWDDLPVHVRVRLLALRMDQMDPDEISEEQARELKDETEKLVEELREAFRPLLERQRDAAQSFVENMQPLVELAEDIENNEQR